MTVHGAPPAAASALRYRCLILDHDDTCVDSTASIHHPAHLQACGEFSSLPETHDWIKNRKLPENVREHSPIDLAGWFRVNHDPGVGEYLRALFGSDEDVMRREMEIWRGHMNSKTPHFYPGMLDILREFRRRGGIVCVVSHSPADVIEKHYLASTSTGEGETEETSAEKFVPDLIFGWSDKPEERKPNPYPCLKILEKFSLRPEECLVLDDLSPGIKMAVAAKVPAYVAAWQHKELVGELVDNCKATGVFWSVEEFRSYVLGADA
eukprot:g4990.t1